MPGIRENWKFHPHPLMANGHLQTFLGIKWPRRYAPYQAKQHFVPLDGCDLDASGQADGDQLVLHEDSPATENLSLPIVLMIHGLAGCHSSTYMCRMAEKLTERGYRVFRMDMRGCGAGNQFARKPTHCGRWQDVAAALYHIAELYPNRATQLVGFSMGGTLTLNMLAEAGNMPVGTLERTLVISPPLDLAHVENHFHTGLGLKYDKFFVKLLWNQNLARWKYFPEMVPNGDCTPPKRLHDLDNLVIAPTGGFSSAEDYYEQASPGPRLTSIRQPVTFFSSEDDPIVPIEPLWEFRSSASIEIFTSRRGGHLGFMSRRNSDPDFRWLDWRILDWLQLGAAEAKPAVQKQATMQPQSV